jgi:hypothetical protein
MSDEYQHPAFLQPPNPEVSLWRYLDFEKFDWLVNCRRLFMPAAHFLGDPLEGTRPAGDLEWWRTQAEDATSEDQRQIIEKNRELLSSFARVFRPNYYVSCWHMNELESKEMWQCYTKTPEAVAIKTSYRELRASLPAYVEIGMVRYIDYATERLPSLNMFEYITHKNIDYCFEREVRVVALSPATEGLGSSHFQDNHFESETRKGFLVFAPQIDVSRLLHGVVLHPESTPEFTAMVITACEKAGLPIPVASAFSGQGAIPSAL